MGFEGPVAAERGVAGVVDGRGNIRMRYCRQRIGGGEVLAEIAAIDQDIAIIRQMLADGTEPVLVVGRDALRGQMRGTERQIARLAIAEDMQGRDVVDAVECVGKIAHAVDTGRDDDNRGVGRQCVDQGLRVGNGAVDDDHVAIADGADGHHRCVIDGRDIDQYGRHGGAALAVGHGVGERGGAVEIQGRAEGEPAIGSERNLTVGDLHRRAARSQSMAVDSGHRQGVAIGQAIMVVAAHIEGNRDILIGCKVIVQRHRRDVAGAEGEVFADRGTAGVGCGDSDVVDAIVQQGADRRIGMQRAGDLAAGGIDAEASGQARCREGERVAFGIGERALGDNGDGRAVEAGLVAERYDHFGRVVYGHHVDCGRCDIGCEATCVGDLERECAISGRRVLRRVLVGDTAQQRINIGPRHRSGGTCRVGDVEHVRRAVIGEREGRRAKGDGLCRGRRQSERLASYAEVLGCAIDNTIGGDAEMREVGFASVVGVGSGRVGCGYRHIALGEGGCVVGHGLLQEHAEIVPTLRTRHVVEIGADVVGRVRL